MRAQGTARTKGLARIEKATFPARQSRRLTSGGKAVRKSFLEKEELANLLRREHRSCTEKKRRTQPLAVVLSPFGLPERFCYFAVDRDSEWGFTFRSGEKR